MAQYDLLLTQNVAAAGIEFSEVLVHIDKGGLLSANTSHAPTVLAVGADTYHLVANSATATGLEWVAVTGGHTQNTDTGTTGATFTVDSDGTTGQLILDAAHVGANYTTTLQNQSQAGSIVVTLPAVTGTLATEAYASGLFASNDAMIFKGTIGSGGTHTLSAFNALTTYNAGWTYRVVEAGTIRSIVCEIGDLVMVLMDRAGSGNVDADFTVAQTNLDGAVIGPASTTTDYVALFSGGTGKLLKAGTGALGTAAYVATGTFATSAQGTTADNAIPKATFTATGNELILGSAASTYSALAIAASTFVGRKASGNVVAMTAAEAMAVLWQTVPGTKTTTGTAGWFARDSNYLYVCTAANIWARTPLSTNW